MLESATTVVIFKEGRKKDGKFSIMVASFGQIRWNSRDVD